ncbi:MAG TPA: hypothetical protein VK666_22865 [Chryseolinea sp.]|nr:hypothetical protein [Chryseolinea sp.]
MKKALVILFLGLSVAAYSQKIKLIEGDLKALKGQTAVKTEFTYDNMSVGKFPKEADYIAQKKKDYNEKEAGKGDKWEEAWVAARKDRYEPQFRELFSKSSDISTVGETSPYTLIFKTVKTEPGYNIGISRSPAFIDAEVWIVDSTSPDKAIAKIQILKAPGMDVIGYDFDSGARIQEAYAKSGKALGTFIKDKIK